MCGCTLLTTVTRDLSDGTTLRVSCQLVVKAYNENKGGVDLSDQMHRFYTCTHKSSRCWYLRLFWFLLDVAIDSAFILASFETVAGQRKWTNKQFREELATELISKCNMRLQGGRQSQDAILRLTQRHFPKTPR